MTTGKRVMLVHGKKSVLEIIFGWLLGSGYQITTATDGHGAWKAFSQQPAEFDLVLMDYELSQLDGEDLVSRMKIQKPELPVVLLVDKFNGGRDEPESPQERSLAMDMPFSISEFMRIVEELAQGNKPAGSVKGIRV